MLSRTAVVIALVIALVLGPSLLSAQAVAPVCSGVASQDVCQKTADIFGLLAPQLGTLVAGGNPTPGQIGPIGGFGHFSLGLRVNGMRADVPDPRTITVQNGAAVRGEIPTRSQWVALPVLDANLGVFRGFPIGMTFVGGLDLLVTGSWLRGFSGDGVRVALAGSNFRLGLGARLGLLRETVQLPAVDLTVTRNQLPTASITSLTDRGDTLSVTGARVRSDSWRFIAGKSYRPLAVAAGFGQDRLRSSAAVKSALAGTSGVVLRLDSPALEQRLTRTNAFVNVALNAAPMRLVGEVGRSWGGSLDTFNDLQNVRADAPRLYGSLAVRIGF